MQVRVLSSGLFTSYDSVSHYSSMKKLLLIALSLLTVKVVYSLQPYHHLMIQGESMTPTYKEHELLFERAYDPSVPLKVGTVVTFRHGKETYIKRVYRLPGTQIGYYFYAGEWKMKTPFNREYLSHFPTSRTETLPNDSVIVLSDDQCSDMTDSRAFGPIKVRDITGILLDQRPPLTHFKYDPNDFKKSVSYLYQTFPLDYR